MLKIVTGELMIKNLISNGWLRFTNNANLQAAFVLMFFLVIFYKDVVFYGKTFLIETATTGTMPKGGPYNYDGIKPGFVANDPGAIAWVKEPLSRFISKSTKNGDFPLWNPYSGLAGTPLLADGHTGPIEPVQFLSYFIPDRYWPYTIDIQLLLWFFLAGFFCYMFAQRQKISFLGSVSAGLLFMLSSYFVTYGNHPQIKTEALLPLVLYGYDRLVDLKEKQGFWFCALCIGWAILAAMPEATFFSLFLGSLWYFYKSVTCWMEAGKDLAEARTIFLRYVGSTILGFLISAAYLLPFLEFVSLAKSVHSAGGGGYAFPLSALPNLIFQIPWTYYLQLGFFALFCLVFSTLSLKDWPLGSRRNIVFFALYAVVFMFTIYDFTPTNWIRTLPVFNQIILSKYPIPSVVFCLAVLAGMLIDGIINIPLLYRKLSLSIIIIFAVFIILPALGDPDAAIYANFANSNFLRIALERILIMSAGLFFLIYLYGQQDISARILQVCLLLLVVSEPFFWKAGIMRPDRVDPFQSPPFVDYLRDDKEPFRIFGLDNTLYPNISTAYRIADIRWLNALFPARAFDFSERFLESEEVKTIRFTGTVLPVSDEMFDLLNVKYILDEAPSIEDDNNCLLNAAIQQPYFGSETLNSMVLEQNTDDRGVLLSSSLNINGVTKATIFAHPPQVFQLTLVLPEASPTLHFSIGLNPEVFQPDRGDGVDFQVALLEDGNEFNLFSKYVDPKNNLCERKWFDQSINLDQWAGREVTLSFKTTSGSNGNADWDWAYWGGLNLKSASSESRDEKEAPAPEQYNLVYQSYGVNVYQNENVFPRAFVVYNIINTTSFDQAMDLLSDQSVDLKQTAVVENFPVHLENLINHNSLKMQSMSGDAKIINSDEVEVNVIAEAPGLLIVTDQYYPGWSAYVDGEPAPIYAVDGIFRGVFLEKGNHIIQFKYQPLSFVIGGLLSLASLLVVFIFLVINRYNTPDKLNRKDS
jgi:hypothetical protein